MSPDRVSSTSVPWRAATLLVLASAAAAAHGPQVPERAEIDGILKQLSSITGMPVRHHLRFQSISRPEIARYLDKRANQNIHPKEIQAEETALKLLGFVPADFDLRKTTLALLTEQAAAFYDYHRKALFLSDWTPASIRDTTIVHELGHALADQNFNLGKFSGKVEDDSEKSAAREAVVEGQATFLMLAYDAALSGQNPLSVHPDTSGFDDAPDSTGDFPVFDKAPLYLRVNLVFPYTWGMAFQAAVVERLGKPGFSEVFRHPPVSTHQILHPEVYFAGEKPVEVKLPKAEHGFKPVFEGDLGELDHRVLIEQFVSRQEAQRIGPRWRGGFFRVVENKRSHARILYYASEWADDKSAASFLGLYRKCLEKKLKRMVVDRADAGSVEGHSADGYFRVAREGRRVSSIEGAPEPPTGHPRSGYAQSGYAQ